MIFLNTENQAALNDVMADVAIIIPKLDKFLFCDFCLFPNEMKPFTMNLVLLVFFHLIICLTV